MQIKHQPPKVAYTASVKSMAGGIVFVIFAACSLLWLSTPLWAQAPRPDIPKGKGERCVEDTSFMRQNHMELLLHQRDATVHQGIRSKKHSLKECISCHAVTERGQTLSVANPKHFCRECHDYASVKVDCFDCHASVPEKKVTGKNPTGL